MSLRIKLVAALVGVLRSPNLQRPPTCRRRQRPPSTAWTGLYIGFNAGYASATVAKPSGGRRFGHRSIPGGIGGAQVGYNYQIGPMVLGLEADFDGSMATKSITAGIRIRHDPNSVDRDVTRPGRLRVRPDPRLRHGGRRGHPTCYHLECGRLRFRRHNETSGAWTAGGGLEAAITSDLSASLEYLYLDTGNFPVAQIGAVPPPPSLR